MKKFSDIYGVILCLVIGGVALGFSSFIPIGAVALSILLGTVVGNLVSLKPKVQKGVSFCEKHMLSLAIAFLGVNLDFQILIDTGVKSLILVILGVMVTILSGIVVGKIFKLDKKMSLLIGIGNGVCGSSAIAATEKIIDAKEEQVGLSIAIVNFLGSVGIFILPLIAKLIFHFSDINSGILIGNTLQAVGQVVASGFSISHSSGQIATIIKMTRILMLFPLVFTLIFLFFRKNKTAGKGHSKPKIPVFIIGFVLFSLIPSFNILNEGIINIIAHLSHYLLIIAMAGIGLKIKFKNVLKEGSSALIVGGIVFFIQIVFSGIVLIFFF